MPVQCKEFIGVRRVPAFYIDRMKPFRKSTQLLVAVTERMKGRPVTIIMDHCLHPLLL